jgi:hypothetical protein
LLAEGFRNKEFCNPRTGATMVTVESTAVAEAARLEALVQARLSGRVRDLRIQVRNHGLILQGQTRTYYAKQLAQHLAMTTSDLPILANEIEVF